jgi:hypothetical protein
MKKFFVCFLAVAMVFAFTAPVMAAGDWSFYGNTRFQTFSEDDDSDKTGTTESDTDTVWYMQGNSRLGGKVSAGDVSGHFEFSVAGQTGATNVGTRHLTGSWNFGAGTLLVGHTWSVITNLLSNQAANAGQGLLGYGSVYQGRSDQIRLTFGGLKLGFLNPRVSAGAGPDIDVTLPKIEVAYRFATDMFWIEPYLGYQSFERQYSAASLDMTDVDSLIYGIKGKVNFGPAYVGFGFTGGTNPTEYGLSGTGQAVTLVGTEYKDVDYMEYMINAGYKMSDMVTFEGGYGAQKTESDPGTGVKTELDNFSYYIQADISLAPGVHLIPEYAKIDDGETKTGAATVDNGGTTYIGAKWQINF